MATAITSPPSRHNFFSLDAGALNCADLEDAAITHPMSVGIIRNQQPQQVNLP